MFSALRTARAFGKEIIFNTQQWPVIYSYVEGAMEAPILEYPVLPKNL